MPLLAPQGIGSHFTRAGRWSGWAAPRASCVLGLSSCPAMCWAPVTWPWKRGCDLLSPHPPPPPPCHLLDSKPVQGNLESTRLSGRPFRAEEKEPPTGAIWPGSGPRASEGWGHIPGLVFWFYFVVVKSKVPY